MLSTSSQAPPGTNRAGLGYMPIGDSERNFTDFKKFGLATAALGVPGVVGSVANTALNLFQQNKSLDFQKSVYADTVSAAEKHGMPHPGLNIPMPSGMYSNSNQTSFRTPRSVVGSNYPSPIYGNNSF